MVLVEYCPVIRRRHLWTSQNCKRNWRNQPSSEVFNLCNEHWGKKTQVIGKLYPKFRNLMEIYFCFNWNLMKIWFENVSIEIWWKSDLKMFQMNLILSYQMFPLIFSSTTFQLKLQASSRPHQPYLKKINLNLKSYFSPFLCQTPFRKEKKLQVIGKQS